MELNIEKQAKVMSVKDWIIALIISYIPVVGLIMLFIWAFSNSGINKNKKNWAKAFLIIQIASIILVILFYVFLLGSTMLLYKTNP